MSNVPYSIKSGFMPCLDVATKPAPTQPKSEFEQMVYDLLRRYHNMLLLYTLSPTSEQCLTLANQVVREHCSNLDCESAVAKLVVNLYQIYGQEATNQPVWHWPSQLHQAALIEYSRIGKP